MFFQAQDYFKQSTTRLYWIADKVVEPSSVIRKRSLRHHASSRHPGAVCSNGGQLLSQCSGKEMTTEMFKDPKRLVEDLVALVAPCVLEAFLLPAVGCSEDISALGLRHVGYGIPTEFFAPFVPGAQLGAALCPGAADEVWFRSAAVDAVKTMEAQALAARSRRSGGDDVRWRGRISAFRSLRKMPSDGP